MRSCNAFADWVLAAVVRSRLTEATRIAYALTSRGCLRSSRSMAGAATMSYCIEYSRTDTIRAEI